MPTVEPASSHAAGGRARGGARPALIEFGADGEPMPVSKPSKLNELMAGVREWIPGLKPRFVEWWGTIRSEPRRVWTSTAFRCACLVAGGVVLLLVTSTISRWIEPSAAVVQGRESRTANFDVLCSDASCGHRFVIIRKFGFRGFPVTCIKCNRPTGQRGRRCSSMACAGKLVGIAEGERGPICAACGQPFAGPAP